MDEVNEQGHAVTALKSGSKKGDQGEQKDGAASSVHQSVANQDRSLLGRIAPGLWYMSDRHPDGDRHRDIPQAEQALLADLLGRLLD